MNARVSLKYFPLRPLCHGQMTRTESNKSSKIKILQRPINCMQINGPIRCISGTTAATPRSVTPVSGIH